MAIKIEVVLVITKTMTLLLLLILPFNSHFSFTALTLFAGQQEGHPACKNWVVRHGVAVTSLGVLMKLVYIGPG